jgi:hypothetical protein
MQPPCSGGRLRQPFSLFEAKTFLHGLLVVEDKLVWRMVWDKGAIFGQRFN